MDYAKLSEKRNKSFTFIPMKDLETHQTTNVVVNDPNANSPSQLHQDLQDEKVPEVYQFQSQDNRVYSDYITMLPTEDIIAQFHKQPHEIHFERTDYQHYFNEKYEYSAPYPTEDNARAIKNAKLVTPQDITTLNIMANLYESQTRNFIITPTTNYDFNKHASHNTTGHPNMLLNALASLARAKINVRGTLIVLVAPPEALRRQQVRLDQTDFGPQCCPLPCRRQRGLNMQSHPWTVKFTRTWERHDLMQALGAASEHLRFHSHHSHCNHTMRTGGESGTDARPP